MTQRFEITIKFTVDKDIVPGMFHKAEDWVAFIPREFMRQTHYHPVIEVISSKEGQSNEAWSTEIGSSN